VVTESVLLFIFDGLLSLSIDVDLLNIK